jgi:hypothetical protein
MENFKNFKTYQLLLIAFIGGGLSVLFPYLLLKCIPELDQISKILLIIGIIISDIYLVCMLIYSMYILYNRYKKYFKLSNSDLYLATFLFIPAFVLSLIFSNDKFTDEQKLYENSTIDLFIIIFGYIISISAGITLIYRYKINKVVYDTFTRPYITWIPISDVKPEIGTYLVVWNDGTITQASINSDGDWTIVFGKFSGDTGEKFINAGEVNREVVYWSKMPLIPTNGIITC